MKLNVGDEVQFESVEETFDVRAASDRFAVCVSGTYHTIVDWEREVRGPNNLISQPYFPSPISIQIKRIVTYV